MSEKPRLVLSEHINPYQYEIRGLHKKTGKFETIAVFEHLNFHVLTALALISDLVEQAEVRIHPFAITKMYFKETDAFEIGESREPKKDPDIK